MTNHYSRMVYASRATFKPFQAGDSINQEIREILSTARRENQKNNLVGALYYGHGCFFQCLEGKQEDIDALYAKLQKDPRHHDLRILSLQPIEQRRFSSWEMKYATIDREVRAFLRTHQLAKFDPYRFTPEMTAELVEVLQQVEETNTDHVIQPNQQGGGVSMTLLWVTNLVSIIATALVTIWLMQA